MNIHIYYNTTDSDNLGLVPIEGSCTAEKTLELVDKKLNSFDVSFKQDIVSVMSDGAAVMQKFGKLSPAYQQLCYNHGLHLAVLKVLYVQKNRKNTSTNFDRHRTDRTEEPLSDSHDDDTEECEDTEDEIQNENNCDSGDSDIETVETIDVCMQSTIKKTITAIRKIVKLFKNSPVKNNILQRYVQEDEKKELKLILDCKTRWNTMEAMIERFLRIRSPIKKALSDLNLENMWNEEYIQIAEMLLATLQPIRIAVENLSREDSSLLTAEGTFRFLFKT